MCLCNLFNLLIQPHRSALDRNNIIIVKTCNNGNAKWCLYMIYNSWHENCSNYATLVESCLASVRISLFDKETKRRWRVKDIEAQRWNQLRGAKLPHVASHRHTASSAIVTQQWRQRRTPLLHCWRGVLILVCVRSSTLQEEYNIPW